MNALPFVPFVIGVAGGSGSDKSTVTRQVLASFGTEGGERHRATDAVLIPRHPALRRMMAAQG